MSSLDYPGPLRDAVAALKKLPGIGVRSAERIALWLLRQPQTATTLATSLSQLHTKVTLCDECGFFREPDLCGHCTDTRRDPALWCIVEQPTDIPAIDHSGGFRGRFLSLGGRLSPLDHIGPNQLRLSPLLRAAENGHLQEIVLALSSDVEGEATSHYIASLLRHTHVRITQLARGMPVGGILDTTDGQTLARALRYRRPLEET